MLAWCEGERCTTMKRISSAPTRAGIVIIILQPNIAYPVIEAYICKPENEYKNNTEDVTTSTKYKPVTIIQGITFMVGKYEMITGFYVSATASETQLHSFLKHTCSPVNKTRKTSDHRRTYWNTHFGGP